MSTFTRPDLFKAVPAKVAKVANDLGAVAANATVKWTLPNNTSFGQQRRLLRRIHEQYERRGLPEHHGQQPAAPARHLSVRRPLTRSTGQAPVVARKSVPGPDTW